MDIRRRHIKFMLKYGKGNNKQGEMEIPPTRSDRRIHALMKGRDEMFRRQKDTCVEYQRSQKLIHKTPRFMEDMIAHKTAIWEQTNQ